MSNDKETGHEMESRLRQMSKDDGDTWDLSDNDKAACSAGAEAMATLQRLLDFCARRDGTLGRYDDWMCCFAEDGSTITEIVERAVKVLGHAPHDGWSITP